MWNLLYMRIARKLGRCTTSYGFTTYPKQANHNNDWVARLNATLQSNSTQWSAFQFPLEWASFVSSWATAFLALKSRSSRGGCSRSNAISSAIHSWQFIHGLLLPLRKLWVPTTCVAVLQVTGRHQLCVDGKGTCLVISMHWEKSFFLAIKDWLRTCVIEDFRTIEPRCFPLEKRTAYEGFLQVSFDGIWLEPRSFVFLGKRIPLFKERNAHRRETTFIILPSMDVKFIQRNPKLQISKCILQKGVCLISC